MLATLDGRKLGVLLEKRPNKIRWTVTKPLISTIRSVFKEITPMFWLKTQPPGNPKHLFMTASGAAPHSNPRRRAGEETSRSSFRWSDGCLPDLTKRKHLPPRAACNYSNNKNKKKKARVSRRKAAAS